MTDRVDLVSELRELSSLHEHALLTDEEYRRAKRRLLGLDDTPADGAAPQPPPAAGTATPEAAPQRWPAAPAEPPPYADVPTDDLPTGYDAEATLELVRLEPESTTAAAPHGHHAPSCAGCGTQFRYCPGCGSALTVPPS